MDLVGDALASMRSGTPIVRRPTLYGPWGLRFVGDRGAGFHAMLRGSAWMLPPGGADPVELTAGDVVFTASGEGFSVADRPDARLSKVSAHDPQETWPVLAPASGSEPSTVMLCGMYALDHGRPHPLVGRLPSVIRLPAGAETDEPLRSVMGLLGGELGEEDRPGTSAAVPALLDLLLLYTLRGWSARQTGRDATGWAKALRDPAVSAALHLLQRSPAKPWTVAGLAAEAGLSRAVFSRRFTELVGEPPLTYLTGWRMTLAGRLLREDDRPLAAVAAQVGYGSEYAFSKAFRRAFGVAPGAYRRAHRERLPARTSIPRG